MATSIALLNPGAGMMMMGWKSPVKILELSSSSSCSRQVTLIHIPYSSKYTSCNNNMNHNIQYSARRLSTALSHPLTITNPFYYYNASNLQQEEEDNNYINNNLFCAEKFMMKKPSVGSSTNTHSGRGRSFVATILASLLSYGVVFTIITMAAACFCTPNSAFAASYGRMGGSSSRSSQQSSSYRSSQRSSSYTSSGLSSSYRSSPPSSSSYHSSSYLSSLPSYSYEDVYNSASPAPTIKHTCTCVSNCTHCNCKNIKEKGNNNEEQVNKSSIRSCSCNCHKNCFFHKKINPVNGYFVMFWIIFGISSAMLTELELIYGPEFWEFWDSLLSDNDYQPIQTNYQSIQTMFVFQVGVSDKERVLQRKLNKIAKNADTSTSNGLNYVLKEVVGALLQHDNSSFLFSHIFAEYDCMESVSKLFQVILNRELHKHGKDEETFVNVEGVKYEKKGDIVKTNRSSSSSSSSIDNMYTVTTVLVLASGRYLIPSIKKKNKTYLDCVAVLQTLQSIPKNVIQSVEILWSPQKEGEVLLEEDLSRVFPLMMPIENVHIIPI